MITCPTAAELQQALDLFEQQAAGPDDGRGVFMTRVADNARALLAREAALGPAATESEQARLAALLARDGDAATLNRQLCDALRSGALAPRDPAVLAHLRATALDRIAIDQPTYCGRDALLG